MSLLVEWTETDYGVETRINLSPRSLGLLMGDFSCLEHLLVKWFSSMDQSGIWLVIWPFLLMMKMRRRMMLLWESHGTCTVFPLLLFLCWIDCFLFFFFFSHHHLSCRSSLIVLISRILFVPILFPIYSSYFSFLGTMGVKDTLIRILLYLPSVLRMADVSWCVMNLTNLLWFWLLIWIYDILNGIHPVRFSLLEGYSVSKHRLEKRKMWILSNILHRWE